MVTALRAVVLYRLLAARLRLPRWAWLQASRCGSMFTAVVVAVSVLVHGQEGATSALLSAFLSLFLCLLLLRLTRGMLIGADLTQTLLDRCDGSRVAAAVCAFARLRVSPDS
jgi:hypothetical protein